MSVAPRAAPWPLLLFFWAPAVVSTPPAGVSSAPVGSVANDDERFSDLASSPQVASADGGSDTIESSDGSLHAEVLSQTEDWLIHPLRSTKWLHAKDDTQAWY